MAKSKKRSGDRRVKQCRSMPSRVVTTARDTKGVNRKLYERRDVPPVGISQLTSGTRIAGRRVDPVDRRVGPVNRRQAQVGKVYMGKVYMKKADFEKLKDPPRTF